MKKIILRADGNSEVGLGHLYRIFALMEMLRESNECVLVTTERSSLAVIPDNYKVSIIPSSVTTVDEAKWFSFNFNPSEYIIIADGYQFNSDYQKGIKSAGFRLVYIDDLASIHMFADVVINHSPSAKKEDYSCEPYTKFGLGTGFAVLRPDFLSAAKRKREPVKNKNVFLCFGGSDPYNLTQKVMQALESVEGIKEVQVVAGGANRVTQDYTGNNNFKVMVHKNLNERELIQLMSSCEFAIAPTSTILFELCCVKMPLVTGFYANNQEKAYHSFVAAHLVEGVGNFLNASTNDIRSGIQTLMNSDYEKYLKCQERYFDGKQMERLVKIILN